MIRVKLFGTLYLQSGVKELYLDADNIKKLRRELARALSEKNPDCIIDEEYLRNCLTAINGKRSTLMARLRDGDEVSFFPPASGG